ncbi:MAG: CPBP family intramembrane metalloprotease, partial [Candidatus Hydrogenedentes bacterium]|nr:CPBP family intramembrane metalloprotease [Candidatus Hydrogenedentota bacterium]
FIAFLAYTFAQVVALFIFLIVVAVFGVISKAEMDDYLDQFVAPAIILSIVTGAIALVTLFGWWTRSHSARDILAEIGWGLGTRVQGITGVLFGLLLAGISLAISHWLVPITDDAIPDYLGRLMSQPGFDVAVAVVAILIAPFLEEYLFRGVLLSALKSAWGVSPAVATTTVLFMLVHLPQTWFYWPATASIISLALLASAVRIKTGRLGPAIALHLSYNLPIVVVYLVLGV